MNAHEARSTFNDRLPSPDEIGNAPQLGTLAILDTVLQASVHTLIAAHPEMLDTDSLVEEALTEPASWLAFSLVIELRAVESVLEHYRLALEKRRAAPHTDDMTF